MQELLESSPDKEGDVSVYEGLPPLLLGFIGREFSCNSTVPGTPFRGWAAGEQTREIVWGERRLLVAPYRHEGVPGLRFQITHKDGSRKTRWHSWDELTWIDLVIPGGVDLE